MSIILSEAIIKKLDFIDQCRERFSLNDVTTLKLPQIIAVGDQSSGKSSILEAISGIKLPKGQNTVTKRPIVVHMRRSDNESCTIRCGNSVYKNVTDVEAKIKEVQGTKVIEEPIFVDVHSPNVPPLTIIDLPGIVKQALIDQPQSIVRDTKLVAQKYMTQENSLILCVIPSNVDFNTVDTIMLASECDRENIRTIGVLTKLDKLSPEEVNSKLDILKNKTKYLKKGYYGLILTDAVLSTDGRARESKEMDEFSKVGRLWQEGKPFLGLEIFTNKLVEELVNLIDLRLPPLKVTMDNYLETTKKELENFRGIRYSQANQRRYLIEAKDRVLSTVESALVKGCCKLLEYKRCVKYLADKDIIKIESKEKERHDTFLYSQHKIFANLYNKLTMHFKDNFKIPTSKYSVPYLQDLAERCSTEHIKMFISSEPFKEVVKLHLDFFRLKSLECLDHCLHLAQCFIADLISTDLMKEYPGLKADFQRKCLDQLDIQNDVTKSHLNLLFKSEARCFTQKILGTTKDTEDKDAVSDVRLNNATDSANNQNTMKTLKMPNSQSMMLPVTRDGDNKSITSRDDSKNAAGKKLKETLEDYIQNMIYRLADVVPNFIMLNLFEEYHSQLQHSLNQFVSDDGVLEHFKLSEEEERRARELTKTENDLETSLKELKTLLKSHGQ